MLQFCSIIAAHHTGYVHAEKYIVLGTDTQILPYGAEFSADVLAKDVGCTRCGWEQPCKD